MEREELLKHTQADTIKELVEKVSFYEDEDTEPPAS